MPENIAKVIRDALPDAVLDSSEGEGEAVLKIDPSMLVSVCEKVRADGFDYLADVTAIDWQDRFEVVYRVTALADNRKVVLRVDLDHANPEVETVTSVWQGANFQEREVYDLMGITFKGHPDLRRILLPEDWEGYPLRKDYVITD